MSIRKRALYASLAAAIFATIMVIGSFYDLEISKRLYNPDSFFAVFFEKTGELPLFLVMPFVGTVAFFNAAGKKHFSVFRAVSALLVIAGWFYFFRGFFSGGFLKKLECAEVYEIIFSLALTALSLLVGKGVPDEVMKKLFPFAIYAAAAVIIAEFFVAAGKAVWDRQRFYTMVAGSPNAPENVAVLSPDFLGFTPWYRINSIFTPSFRTESYIYAFLSADSGAFRSFPSGHSAAAASSFIAAFLPHAFPKLKYRPLFYILPAAWTAATALSRIVAGAHYLTDIAVGAAVMLIAVFGVGKIYKKKCPVNL